MVFHLKKHNLTVTVTHGNRFGPIVQLALGSEVRTLQLAEFTDFLLSMIEEGRKATSAYLESLGAFSAKKNARKEKTSSHTCS